jgi:hypothetical protein
MSRVVGWVVEDDRGAHTMYAPSVAMVERAARALWAFHGGDDPTPWEDATNVARQMRRKEAAIILTAALGQEQTP